MMITLLTPKMPDIDECPEMQLSQPNSPLHELFLHVIDALNTHPALTKPKYCAEKSYTEPGETPDPPSQSVNIEVYFVDNKEAFEHWEAPHNSVGLFAINSGVFESVDDDVLSKAYRVLVNCNEMEFATLIRRERQQEANPNSDRHDLEYLMSYLNSVTHEIAHAVEFAEHTNGLSPSAAFNLYEMGVIQASLLELSTGHGILYADNDDITDQEHIDIMETRVEEKGRKWLSELTLDNKLINSALRTYAPKPSRNHSPSP
ncbi:hypothetical protein AB6D11_00460 [Vibrio splendidus]